MKEIKDIIQAYHTAQKEEKQAALATVVHLEGSAYRRPGARMLVTIAGKLTGAISGGCLEGDTLRKAQLAMVQQKPMLVTYDTTDDDDTTLGVGLGCNGIISILIEPINHADPNNPIQLLKTFLLKRQAAVMVTLFSLNKKAVQPGTCMLITKEETFKNNLLNGDILKNVLADADEVLNTGKDAFKLYNQENPITGFIEFLEIPVSLLVFGAGNDSLPLVQIATILGWETTVVDGRANYASRERFLPPTSLLISKPGNILSSLEFDERTVACLMTHNYNYDIEVLRQLVATPVSYIGVLGPKKKMIRMLEELNEKGTDVDRNSLSKIFGPAGLDVGAETSEEIALSIISEIKAVLSKRKGGNLREKNVGIHADDTSGKLVQL